MIPRTPVYQGNSADDATHETAQLISGESAKAAIEHHAECVRAWLAAPLNERAYYSDRIKTAWQDLRTYGMASQSTAAAISSGMMRAQQKLRGRI